jgi:tetratricopeptide (TPR) repeat protein
MLRRATLAGIVLGLSCAIAAAMGPDLSNLNGNETYERARTLIKAGAYDEAIPLLMQLKAEFKTSADVPNWLGFCHRKLKDYPRAKSFYDEALTYNPTHLGANEYLGEWYVETGDLAKAREQLAYITGLCGNCEEAKDLAEALARAPKTQ